MGQSQNISSGGQGWSLGLMSFLVGLGLFYSAVWILPQKFGKDPVVQLASWEGQAVPEGVKLKPAVTSGIILIYSLQPWGGAVSPAPETPCHRDAGEQTGVPPRRNHTGVLNVRATCVHRTVRGAFHPTIGLPLRFERHEVHTHLHRT